MKKKNYDVEETWLDRNGLLKKLLILSIGK